MGKKKSVCRIGGITSKEQMNKLASTRVSGKKTVIKAAVKPKLLTQTPCGMANSTKACPYIPPAKKNTKPNL